MAKKSEAIAKAEGTQDLVDAFEEGGAIEKAEEEPSPYAIVSAPIDQVREIIALNLAGKKISVFDLDRIRIPDGKTDFWTVPTLEGSEAMEKVSGVVIQFQDIRGWWPTEDITGDPPSCRSDDTKTGFGARAHGDLYPEETDVRNVTPHECKTCAYAAWESDPKAGRGQWCGQKRALLIIMERIYLPMVMFLPPTSIKGVEKFFFRAGSYGEPFNGMVTSFKLVKDKNQEGQVYNRAEPSRARGLSPTEREAFGSYSEAYMEATR